MVMRLSQLLAELPDARLVGPGDVQVSAVSQDSRTVGTGALFVAVPGLKVDGHDFIPQALAAGAAAVAVQSDREEAWRPALAASAVPGLVVPDSRAALPRLAAAPY